MGIREWSYGNEVSLDLRYKVPMRDQAIALRDIKAEVELGYDVKLALGEAHRCLKSTGLKKIGKRYLCTPPRPMRDRKAGADVEGHKP